MANYTTPLTVTPGAAALASDWNTYVRDNTVNINDRLADVEDILDESGIVKTDNIPNLDASKIATGTISADRLPDTGKVLQVVTAVNSTGTSLSGSFQDIGISVSITPTSASSTLVVEWIGTLGAGQNTNGTAAAYSRIVDSSNVLVPGSASQVSGYDGENDNAVSGTVLSRGIVSAGDTSARTYKAQARHSAYNGSATNCSMMVWEIAG